MALRSPALPSPLKVNPIEPEVGGVLRLTPIELLAWEGLVPIAPGVVPGFVECGGDDSPGEEFEVLEDCCAAGCASKVPKLLAAVAGDALLSVPDRGSCVGVASPVVVEIFIGLWF